MTYHETVVAVSMRLVVTYECFACGNRWEETEAAADTEGFSVLRKQNACPRCDGEQVT